MNFLLTLKVAQAQVLLLKLLSNVTLLRLHLLRESQDATDNLFLSAMGQLVQSLVHFGPDVIDALIKLHVKLASLGTQNCLTFLHLSLPMLQTLLQLNAQFFKRFLVCLEGLLLSHIVEVLSARTPRQLVMQILELILKLKLHSLEQLLHLNYLSFAVENGLDLLATRLGIQCGQGELFVKLSLHPLVELL